AARLNGDAESGRLVMAQLDSWWQANPPFRGIHWTSGIEIGMRLISWVWIRRLLDYDDRAPAWFEENPRFLDQLYAHQLWLDRLPSHGTSANNHAVAEWAGLFSAACAFPSFPESSRWRDKAGRGLIAEARRQIDADGVGRELATDYHGFVAELFMLAGLEGEAARSGLGNEFWVRVRSMVDVVAAVLDVSGRPPRQGDSDDANALVVDGPGFDRWASLLATGSSLFGQLDWWPMPQVVGDVRSSLLASFASVGALSGDRPSSRPVSFPESGMTILRGRPDIPSEIWCRCDGGPLGFMSTAAHGHDDALSVELRHDGVDVLADPGTYCYQLEPFWRSYFRSIRAHNTLELAKARHAQQTGPFIWSSSERSGVTEISEGPVTSWTGFCIRDHVDGGEIEHRRKVVVDHAGVTIEDVVDRSTSARLRFHLGPLVECALDGNVAQLSWVSADGRAESGRMDLSVAMSWRAVRGDEREPLGWYSPGFDVRVASYTLEGEGEMGPGVGVTTRLQLGTEGIAEAARPQP
ncbi:MAG TPA: alginate lyase family protein, partial [Acidimicrobiia bacterium]|nr:alginate lyase family protein [Acidimicrobiia bacterium]